MLFLLAMSIHCSFLDGLAGAQLVAGEEVHRLEALGVFDSSLGGEPFGGIRSWSCIPVKGGQGF